MTERWTLVEVDLAGPVHAVSSIGDETNMRILLWHGHELVGHLDVTRDQLPISASHLAEAGAFSLAQLMAARRAAGGALAALPDGRPDLAPIGRLAAELVETDDPDDHREAAVEGHLDLDVIVCTRGRGDALAATLEALLAQQQAPASIIVVDNNDRPDPDIAAAAGAAGAIVVREPRPGLSVARNAGLRQATAPLVAFTDDDAIPHPRWTATLAAVFAVDPETDVVTGMVAPTDLASPAAVAFEVYERGFDTGYLPIRFGPDFLASADHTAPPVWMIGAGANMAFRRTVFDQVGDFDERLGAGAVGCSEDSEIWYRTLAAGRTCRYEPSAIVGHRHRASAAARRAQLRAYLRGHVAALIVQSDTHGHVGNLRRMYRTLPRFYAAEVARALRHRQLSAALDAGASTLGLIEGATYRFRTSWRARGRSSS